MKDPTRSKELADLARDLGIDPAKCAALCARAEPFLSVAAAPRYSFRALVPLLLRCCSRDEHLVWAVKDMEETPLPEHWCCSVAVLEHSTRTHPLRAYGRVAFSIGLRHSMQVGY